MSEATCIHCGGAVKVGEDFQRIVGYERKASSSSSRRGGSDVVLRKPVQPARWLCRFCVERERRGVAVGQESLA